jgi:hypothetical protein
MTGGHQVLYNVSMQMVGWSVSQLVGWSVSRGLVIIHIYSGF